MQPVYSIVMSVPTPDVDDLRGACRPTTATPVELEAGALESTAPEYLRDLKRELHGEDLVPAALEIEASFDRDCSLATQREIDRVREAVRAGSFLGVARVRVRCVDVANPSKVRPALAACGERAEREGLSFAVDGAISLEAETPPSATAD